MCGFYRKFVPNISRIVIPITNLMRNKVSFSWTDECQNAFDELKSKLLSAPVLGNYQPEIPFVFTTDASDQCVGAVLHEVQADGSTKNLGYFPKKICAC